MTLRLIRLLCRLTPRRFRHERLEELYAVLVERVADEASGGRPVAFAARELWGAVRLLSGLWVDEWTKRPRRAGMKTMLEGVVQDLRYAARSLGRNRGFALAAVTVVALGIGANAAIFSAVNAFFFRPLPFTEPSELVTIFETNPEFGWHDAHAAGANLLDWRDQVAAFDDVSGYNEFIARITTLREGEPVNVNGAQVLGNFFTTLGVAPQLGRVFAFDDSWESESRTVVISHRLWQEYFGGDPDVVGRLIRTPDESLEVVGVMGEGFHFPSAEIDLWYTPGWATEVREQVWFRRAHGTRAFARLAPGTTLEEADAQLQVVVARLQQDYPETNSVMGAGIMPMHDFLIREVRTQLLVLLGAVGLLLVLACTNVANLMLVRANDRTREVALRRALGAARARVARQMMGESLLVAVAGAGVGLALGWIGLRAIVPAQSLGIDGATSLALDHRVVLFTAGLAAASGLLFGAAPAMRSWGAGAGEALRDGGRGSTAGRSGQRTVSALVTAEVALALLLVVGAGLMVRTFVSLRTVDPGFETQDIVSVRVSVPSGRYESRDQVLAFYDRLIELLEARPAVESAGTVARLPLTGTNWTSSLKAEGWEPERVAFEVAHRRADAAYFETVGTPLLRGRLFGPQDGPDDPLVVVVNEAFVREHFRPDEEPLGTRVAYDREPTEESYWYEIIGVVADQHQMRLADPPLPEVFENRDQDWGRANLLVVRGTGGSDALFATIRAVLQEMDPLIPITQAETLRDVWSRSMEREAFLLKLLGVFGVVALLLATVGVYGVTAQAARRRTQEIGIRIALGAAAPDVLRLMLRQGVTVIAIGLALGLVAALLAGRALSTLLYGVEPGDPVTLGAVAVLLGSVGLAACWIPARRATVLDPVASLRAE